MIVESKKTWLLTRNVMFFCSPKHRHWTFKLLLCPGYTEAQKARQNHARRSQTKNCWFYLVSLTKNWKENWRKLARLSQTAPDSVPFCKQSKILTLPGTIWPTSFKFPANFWSRKLDRTGNFFIWLRLAWFCLAVWAWCSQSIKLTELKLSALPNSVNPGKNLLKNIR